MKTVCSAFLLLILANVAHAYNPIKAQPAEPYAVIPIEGDLYVEHHLLGDLEDYPDMYEFSTDVAVDLKLSLKQRDTKSAVPFGIIIVRQNDDDGGVTEIARQNQPLEEWVEVRESSLGISFLQSATVEESIAPGTYRIEVSTPDNNGTYMLLVGDESVSSGFFKAFAQIYMTQRHFGFTPLHLLFSSYVYYPIGILLVAYGIYCTYQYRKKIYRA